MGFPFKNYVPSLNEFKSVYEAKQESQKNYIAYRHGKEPLKFGALLHPEGDDVFDFVRGKINKNFWQMDPKRISKIGTDKK